MRIYNMRLFSDNKEVIDTMRENLPENCALVVSARNSYVTRPDTHPCINLMRTYRKVGDKLVDNYISSIVMAEERDQPGMIRFDWVTDIMRELRGLSLPLEKAVAAVITYESLRTPQEEKRKKQRETSVMRRDISVDLFYNVTSV